MNKVILSSLIRKPSKPLRPTPPVANMILLYIQRRRACIHYGLQHITHIHTTDRSAPRQQTGETRTNAAARTCMLSSDTHNFSITSRYGT
jgi:hypothetical protein